MQSLLQHIKLPHFRHKWLITLLAFSIPVYQKYIAYSDCIDTVKLVQFRKSKRRQE